jgi:hypothetical protein
MNHDTKVGLGLGILLVGIVSAFYFREQPTFQDPLPEIQSVEALDREISDSLSVVDQQSTALQKFEHQFKPELRLGQIDLSHDLPAVADHPQQVAPESETLSSETEIASVDENLVPTFDPEFEFLNEPEVGGSTVSTPDTTEDVASSDPLSDKNRSVKIPAQAVVQSEGNPPKELPLAAEMFSEDLQSSQVIEEQIPLQLDPITIDSPVEVKPELDENDGVNKAPSAATPQRIEPVRDPRIIVPKRVRLNEPIARRTLEEFRGTQDKRSPDKTMPSLPKSRRPATLNEGLPSLEGLEPIDPAR